MAPSPWHATAARLRRLLTVGGIATSNVHKCFNGLEQYMLAPPEICWRSSFEYGDEDAYQDESDPEIRSHVSFVQSASFSNPVHEVTEEEFEAESAVEHVPCTTSYSNDQSTAEEYQEDPIDSQFGPIGDQSHRYVSRHVRVGGPLTEHIVDEPSYFYLLTTYISYMILIFIGHVRDFFGKRFKPAKYLGFKEQEGYAALNSDFDNFYFRRLKARMNHCFIRPITGVPGRYITLMDRISHDYNDTFEYTGTYTETLNLSSYNYLGFAQSSGPCANDVEASISLYGISTSSTRLETGTTDLTVEVEREIARFVGKEDAMVFSMGFSTNATSFPDIVGPGCLILSDELNHASIRVGARLSGAMIKSYKHNDMEDLERLLREAISQGQPKTHKAWKKILVVCEGLFSMEGTIADLPEICRLKKRYKFYLFIDEAHSIGALGPRGRGICDYFNIDTSEVNILMGTLTKSFGANGGYVAADRATI